MEVMLIIFMNISFMFIIFFEYKAKSLSFLFWGSLFFAFCIPHSIDLIFKTNIYSLDVMNEASIYVIGFNIVYLLTRYLLVYRKFEFDWNISEQNINIENRFMKYLFMTIFLSVILWVVGLYKVTGSIYSSSWSDTLQVRGIYSNTASYLFMSSCGLFILLFIKKKSIFLKAIFILLALTVVFLTRARINLIPIIVPIIVYQLFYIKNYKAILKVVIIGLIFIFLVSFLQQFRYLGGLNSVEKIDIKSITGRTTQSILSGKGEFALRLGMYKFISNKNEFVNFGKGMTYIRLLLLPFPNSIIKIKPRDFAYDMWDVIYPYRTGIGGTYHPTFFGDLYGNFGSYGFIFGLVWALIFLAFDKLANRLSNVVKLAIIAPFSIMYLLLARGAVYNAIANGFWSFLIINIIFLVSRVTLNKQLENK